MVVEFFTVIYMYERQEKRSKITSKKGGKQSFNFGVREKMGRTKIFPKSMGGRKPYTLWIFDTLLLILLY